MNPGRNILIGAQAPGVALPTVADIHHAHYFKIRAITRLAAPTEPLWIVPQTEETSQAEEKSEAKAA